MIEEEFGTGETGLCKTHGDTQNREEVGAPFQDEEVPIFFPDQLKAGG